jgi:hypothetical protein
MGGDNYRIGRVARYSMGAGAASLDAAPPLRAGDLTLSADQAMTLSGGAMKIHKPG